MNTITKATEYAVKINSEIEVGNFSSANDLLMCLSEKLSKECKLTYSDAKQMIWFCMGNS